MVELLVVMGVIMVLIGSTAWSVAGAQKRARIQKATSDVKVISQAILAYENYERGDDNFELPTLKDQEADKSTIGFLLGEGESAKSGGKIPVLLMASLRSGQKMVDPWGTPYRIKITESSVSPQVKTASGSMQTGYFLPNFYRLAEGER